MGWEVLVFVVPALLTWCAYCGRQAMNTYAEGRRWLNSYLKVQGGRQADSLTTILSAVLEPLAGDYFDLFDAEEPPLQTSAELAHAVKAIREERDPRGKAYLYREAITKPVVSGWIHRMHPHLKRVVDETVDTLEVQAALFELEVIGVSPDRVQRRLRSLSHVYFFEAVLSFVTAATFTVAGFTRMAPPLTFGVSLVVPAALIAGYLGLEHLRLRMTLSPQESTTELLHD